MLEGAIQSEGVEEVFSTDSDMNAEAVDLFGEDYLERIKRIKLPNTKIRILTQLSGDHQYPIILIWEKGRGDSTGNSGKGTDTYRR